MTGDVYLRNDTRDAKFKVKVPVEKIKIGDRTLVIEQTYSFDDLFPQCLNHELSHNKGFREGHPPYHDEDAVDFDALLNTMQHYPYQVETDVYMF